MKADLNGVDISDIKDTDKDTDLFGEAGHQSRNSCFSCTKSMDQCPISLKAPFADYISFQIEQSDESGM